MLHFRWHHAVNRRIVPLLFCLPFANRASDSGDLYIDFDRNHLIFLAVHLVSKLRPGSIFPSGARICIAYYIPHIMPCFASCCLRIAPWLIVVSFACVLALGRIGRRVCVRGTYRVRLQGSSFRLLGELCRQDDHTLEITSIFAC